MQDWRDEWGYQALFSRGSSKKAGVAMFLITISPFKSQKLIRIPRDAYSDTEGQLENISFLRSIPKGITNHSYRFARHRQRCRCLLHFIPF